MRLSILCVAFAAALAGPPNDRSFAEWVRKQVQELQPSREERRMDEVGWVRSVLEAERLSKQHKRPVFLFTHDGRMETGRC